MPKKQGPAGQHDQGPAPGSTNVPGSECGEHQTNEQQQKGVAAGRNMPSLGTSKVPPVGKPDEVEPARKQR